MAINKPNIPDAELPEDWGGTQYPYTEEQIENGLPEAVPTVIDGGNLNYEKRGLFQNIKYLRVFSDWLRSIPIGKIPVVNSNGQLDYETPVVDSSVVHNTGDEIVNGIKKLQALTMRAGSATEGGEIVLEKNTGGNISDVKVDVANNLFRVFATNSSGNTVVPLQVDFNNSCMLAMTPSSATDNSTKVATTAWVNTRLGGTGITSTELGYLDGVTSNIQTQLNAKAASITGGASTIATSNLTASRALVSDGSGKVAVSSVTSTQLGYLSGVTSAIQTQLNGKLTASTSKAENGYVKFSNGIIIQWGKLTNTGTENTITFPTAFTSTNVSVTVTYGQRADGYTAAYNITATGCTLHKSGSANQTIQWIAIGY